MNISKLGLVSLLTTTVLSLFPSCDARNPAHQKFGAQAQSLSFDCCAPVDSYAQGYAGPFFLNSTYINSPTLGEMALSLDAHNEFAQFAEGVMGANFLGLTSSNIGPNLNMQFTKVSCTYDYTKAGGDVTNELVYIVQDQATGFLYVGNGTLTGPFGSPGSQSITYNAVPSNFKPAIATFPDFSTGQPKSFIFIKNAALVFLGGGGGLHSILIVGSLRIAGTPINAPGGYNCGLDLINHPVDGIDGTIPGMGFPKPVGGGGGFFFQ